MTDVLAVADRTWRRLRVPADVRADMRAELASDLDAAAGDGRSALDYVGGDPAGLARVWAAERGVVRPRPRLAGLTAATLLAMLPGAAFGLLLVVAPSSMFLNDLLLSAGGRSMVNGGPGGAVSFTYAVDPPAWLALGWYLLAAASAYGGALAAASAVLLVVGDVARRPTVRALAWVLPTAGVPATVAGVLVASARGYEPTGGTLAAACLAPLAVIAAAIVLTRVAVTRRRPAPAGQAAVISSSKPSSSWR